MPDPVKTNAFSGGSNLTNGYLESKLNEALAGPAEPEEPSSPTAADVAVEAGSDGLDAGTVQAALQALASRIAALEA